MSEESLHNHFAPLSPHHADRNPPNLNYATLIGMGKDNFNASESALISFGLQMVPNTLPSPPYQRAARHERLFRARKVKYLAVKRRLFNILAAVSLFLFLATVAAWGYCLASAERKFEIDSRHTLRLQNSAATLQVSDMSSHIVYPTMSFEEFKLPGAFSYRQRWDTYKAGTPNEYTVRAWRAWRVSYWILSVVFAAVPSIWFVQLMRDRRTALRRARGLCGNCGYDLRASKECCPECGSVICPERADDLQ